MLRSVFIEDWQYKLLAFLMSVTLWFLLNLGERVPIAIERQVELVDQEQGYEYRLERKRVKIRLMAMERLVSEEVIEKITVRVSVKGLKEGEYTVKPHVHHLPAFLVSLERIEPEYIKVRVLKAPSGGH
ncbi:MAG: hypothetical protein NZ526_01845 [Aquificaceae bacterium]|nr:hypothetical protein [Aquificaceae bacterium]MDW8095802.1 hypothetical protein [Aquificaceae bacterium]